MLKPWAWHFGEYLSWILSREHSLQGLPGDSILSDADQGFLLHALSSGYEHCGELGLDPGGQLERLRARLYMSLESNTIERPTVGELRILLRTLHDSLDRELRTRSFLFVPAQKAELYEQAELFGAEVHTKFGRASTDIREAGTCLALSRPTAAVFHLMCVLEVALDSLAAAVGLPFSKKNWEQILQDIEKAVPSMPSQDRDYYSRAVLEFRFFRDAWRNHTMHGRQRYTDGQAREILGHTKAFMFHLSARLEQRPE